MQQEQSSSLAMTAEECLRNCRQLSLDELIKLIATLLSPYDGMQDQIDPTGTSTCNIEYPRSMIMSLLQLYASYHPDDWHRYESWNTEEPYSRNLIAHQSNRFTLMLVCWKGPSPVHNHAGSDCLMTILRGKILETKYQILHDRYQVDDLQVKETMILREGEVDLINDKIGLHKMELSDGSDRAVTLHCYIPPYDQCFTFTPVNNEIKIDISHTTYDTEFGQHMLR